MFIQILHFNDFTPAEKYQFCVDYFGDQHCTPADITRFEHAARCATAYQTTQEKKDVLWPLYDNISQFLSDPERWQHDMGRKMFPELVND